MKKYHILVLTIFLAVLLPITLSQNESSREIFSDVKKIGLNHALADCDDICEAQKDLNKAWKKFIGKIEEEGSAIPAVGGGIGLPFGGRVIAIFPCPCNASVAFITAPVAGPAGPFIVPLFGSSLKMFKVIAPGNHVLGSALPVPTPCESPFLCLPVPVPFTVTPSPGVGTSLIP